MADNKPTPLPLPKAPPTPPSKPPCTCSGNPLAPQCPACSS